MSGRETALVVAFWGLLNALLAALLLAFTTDAMSRLVYWAGVATVVVVAVAVAVVRSQAASRRWIPEASAGAAVLAAALAFVAVGLGVGLWAVLIGGGLLVIAAVLLVAERFAG